MNIYRHEWWSNQENNKLVVVKRQDKIAIYENEVGYVVIRQDASNTLGEDSFVFIDLANLRHVIKALEKFQSET